mgnify:CR=1 FL=1
MSCVACFPPRDITDRYCTNCGADLTAHHIACPNGECGYSYNGDVARLNYCPRCGAAFPAQE